MIGAHSSEEELARSTSSLSRRGRALTGALLLAVAGSAIWEYLGQPGLSLVGRAILNVFTLGSTAVRDYVYRAARLDVSAEPSLTLLALVAAAPVYFIFGLVRHRPGRRGVVQLRAESRRLEQEHREAIKSEDPAAIAALRRKLDDFDLRLHRALRRSSLILLAGGLGLYLLAQFLFFLVRQPAEIRRVFLGNLAIVAPYLSEEEEEHYLARFTTIRGRDDYIKLDENLQHVARSHGVRLTRASLW